MTSQDPIFEGRTNLKRNLSYRKYIHAFRLTLGFFILAQVIPFAIVIVSSV